MLETGSFKDVIFAKGTNHNVGGKIDIFLYVVDGLLIDCGPQSMQEDISAFLRTQRITQAMLTHMHEDHSGMASWVQKELHVPIYLDAGDIEGARRDGQYRDYRRITWGDRPGFEPLPLPDRINTDKYSFEVVATPGHMAHHNVLFERNMGWLFSGDMFVRRKIRFCAEEENIKQYMESLEKMLSLDFDTVFCAHAGIVENGREKLCEKLAFLKDLQKTVEQLRRRGLKNREISQEIFPGEPLITEVSEGEWSSYNIIKSI